MVSTKSLCLLLMLSGFICHGAIAQSTANDLETISGIVESSDGTPIEDAEVWLVAGKWNEPKVVASAKSNSDGTFEFKSEQHDTLLNEGSAHASVLARHESHGFGWFNGLQRHSHQPNRQDIKVELTAVGVLNGQVIDASGQPVPDAVIYPETLYSKILSSPNNEYAQIPEDFFPAWQTKTDKNGRFSIDDLPSIGAGSFQIKHSAVKNLSVQLNLGQPATITLEPTVACSGKIEPPVGFDQSIGQQEGAHQENVGTIMLSCYSGRDKDGKLTTDQSSVAMRYVSKHSAPIENDLSFHFDGVTPGAYRVNFRFSDSIHLVTPAQIPVWNVSKETEPLVVQAVPTFRVSGKAVSSTTADAVVGATITMRQQIGDSWRYLGEIKTDDKGNYFKYVPAGKLLVRVTDTPVGFVPSPEQVDSELAEQPVKKVDVSGETNLPDIKLDPACDVVRKVFDEHGEPAAGAIVKVVTQTGSPDGGYRNPVQKTDANGHYTIRQVAVNDTLPIWVRTPTAISEPLVVTPGDLDGPLEVTLSTEGVRFRVRVINEDDEPVSGVSVSLSTPFMYKSKWSIRIGISGGAGTGKTDENGQFVSGPLWSGKRYKLTASGEGFSKAETPRLEGKSGEIVDSGNLIIAAVRVRGVQGTVVDSGEAPVIGATVFCAGEQYSQAVAITDNDGHFELEKVAADLKYVFVRHPDFRFGGTVVSDPQSVKIQLRSREDPNRPVRKLKSLTVEQQHSGAKKLILQALELPIAARNSSRIGLLCALDRNLATERLTANGDGLMNRFIRTARAQRLDLSDAHKVTLLLRTLPQRSAFEVSRRYCRRLLLSDDASDHAIADVYLKFAEEVVGDKLSRKIDLAGLYSRSGKVAKAQTLIDEILTTIEAKGLAYDKYPLGKLCEALAPLDFDQAMELTKKLEEGYRRTSAQAEIALAILHLNQEKSLALIDQLKGDSNAKNIRDKTRYRAAVRLVDTAPEKAIDLVYQCEGEEGRSQALGRLAVRVAEFDRPRSWQMIEDAIDVFKRPRGHSSWSYYGGHGVFAAAVAYQAKLVEYPDMESIVWHVVSACRSGSDKGQQRIANTVSTARMLALTDKFSARRLLGLVSAQQDQIPRETHDLSIYDQYLQAWTLVDFGRGTSLIRADLENIEKLGPDHFRYGHGGVFKLLVAPTEERFHVLFQQTGLWQLEEDGTERPW